MRLGPSCGRDGAVRTFPRELHSICDQLQGVLLAKPGRSRYWPYRYADKWIFEDRLEQNPPRVARAYALIAAVLFDAFIASQDGKFAYWYIRPHQLDPRIVPLFPVPHHPSYPSNHSTFSAARSEILAYLFPARADFIRAVGKEGGRLENLGWHSLPNGQCGWCAAWEVRSPGFHLVGAERWFTVGRWRLATRRAAAKQMARLKMWRAISGFINAKAAKALGLTIPQPLLRATR